MGTVTLPTWLFGLILLFAAVTMASHFLFPSVRWFFRRRLERAVARLNKRLARPIEPFKLARRHDTIQRVSYDPAVLAAVTEHAREEGVPEEVAFERAQRYAREIVPRFSAFAYFGFAIRAARLLATTLYQVRLARLDEQELRAIDPEATMVFVINHRSNLDYVLVTYLVAQQTTLSYAVGEWARVWPLRTLIRAMGAYFIRRGSRTGLYRRVLATYVAHATRGGVAQAVFPEGGLSLTGGLESPRLGILNYITEAKAAAVGRDVVFVPVALNYERVLEDRVLIAAATAGNRRFPMRIRVVVRFTARFLWQKLRGRAHRFGYAAVSFGRPMSLAGFSGDTEALGHALMDRIGEVMPVLPQPLLAALLLEAAGPVERRELQRIWAERVAALGLYHEVDVATGLEPWPQRNGQRGVVATRAQIPFGHPGIHDNGGPEVLYASAVGIHHDRHPGLCLVGVLRFSRTRPGRPHFGRANPSRANALHPHLAGEDRLCECDPPSYGARRLGFEHRHPVAGANQPVGDTRAEIAPTSQHHQ